MTTDPVTIVIAVVTVGALATLVVLSAGMTRYAMELRRAAERARGETERAVFWSEVQVALNTRPRWAAALLQQIHRLVGGLVAESDRQL